MAAREVESSSIVLFWFSGSTIIGAGGGSMLSEVLVMSLGKLVGFFSVHADVEAPTSDALADTGVNGLVRIARITLMKVIIVFSIVLS